KPSITESSDIAGTRKPWWRSVIRFSRLRTTSCETVSVTTSWVLITSTVAMPSEPCAVTSDSSKHSGFTSRSKKPPESHIWVNRGTFSEQHAEHAESSKVVTN